MGVWGLLRCDQYTPELQDSGCTNAAEESIFPLMVGVSMSSVKGKERKRDKYNDFFCVPGRTPPRVEPVVDRPMARTAPFMAWGGDVVAMNDDIITDRCGHVHGGRHHGNDKRGQSGYACCFVQGYKGAFGHIEQHSFNGKDIKMECILTQWTTQA